MGAFRLAAAAVIGMGALAAANYTDAIQQWRTEREARLKADGGWLTVAGLFWLNPGENTAGAGAANSIVLPRGPERIGVFELRDGHVTFRPAPNSPVTSCGIVPSLKFMRTIAFFACSVPLRMASATSFALPNPQPTYPRRLPMTMEERRGTSR